MASARFGPPYTGLRISGILTSWPNDCTWIPAPAPVRAEGGWIEGALLVPGLPCLTARTRNADTRDPHFLIFGEKLLVYTGTAYVKEGKAN